MTIRRAALILASSILALATVQNSVAAREGSNAKAQHWKAPKTAWGDPDLRGMWPLDSVGRTPMQRPEALGDKAWLTDAEFEAAKKAAAESAQGYAREDAANKIGAGHWFEWGEPLRQTSLIMEPANGRIPPLTPAGEAKSKAMRSSWSQTVFEGIEDFNSLDRCITRGLPASMIPFPYNNGVEIFQSPGWVAIRLELIHETRLIPVDGRPQLPGTIRPWLGSSRGHWEGDTLVIETTNFNGEPPMNIVGPGNKPIPTSVSLHMVERLTRTGLNTIQYEARIEDPEVLTAPFTMRFPWTRSDTYQSFEYACHEGNTVVSNYIRATSPRFPNTGSAMDAATWVRRTVTPGRN